MALQVELQATLQNMQAEQQATQATIQSTQAAVQSTQADVQSIREMMNTFMTTQLVQQGQGPANQTEEIVEDQSPSSPFAGQKSASTMSVTPAGSRADTGTDNG